MEFSLNQSTLQSILLLTTCFVMELTCRVTLLTAIQPFSITMSTDSDQDDQQVLFNFLSAQIFADEFSE